MNHHRETCKPTLAKEVHEYSSVLIELPKLLATKVVIWGKDNVKDEDLYTVDKLHGREDEIHITLLYGIYSESAAKVFSVLQHQPPFEVALGKVSLFSNDIFDVVKIEAFSPALIFLNKLLESNIDNRGNGYSYRPHVTIAYLHKNHRFKLQDVAYFEGIKWTVNTVHFSSRCGNKSRIRLENSLVPVRCC